MQPQNSNSLSSRIVLFCVLSLTILLLSVALFLGYIKGDIKHFFNERNLITIYSTLLILGCSLCCWLIFRIRRFCGPNSKNASSIIWCLIAIGFLFLAFDEYFLLHEKLDNFIHDIFHLKETGITDRIDDFIIGFYGMAGLLCLYIYRQEINLFPQLRPLLITGFCFLFIMVFLDALTNRTDILANFFDGPHLGYWHTALCLGEESSKILAESFFFAGFFHLFKTTRG